VAAMLLSQAGIKAPKKSKAPRKGPLLFPRSGRLFRTRSQENVLAESMIKAVLRSGSKLQFYGYALLAYTTAVAVCPQGPYRYAVGLAVAALLAWMGKSFAKEALAEAYVSLFPWKDGVRYEALWKAGAGIALPGCLWLALLAGLLNAGPVAGILMLPAGAVVCYASSRILGVSGT
jgi:ABC-2 type transport system permease protein